MAKFCEIPQFTRNGSYQVNVSLDRVPVAIAQYQEQGLELCPDFQRGRVWTDKQQTAFMEYLLRGGTASRVIYFNHPGWMRSFEGDFVLVDGLQRITAVLRFFKNEIPACGHYFAEYQDSLRMSGPDLLFNVNNLQTRSEVLTWYIEMNAGGTPHTPAEIERVRRLYEAETNRQNGCI